MSSKYLEAFNNITPPPGIIPSWIADFVAFNASYTLNFFYLNCISVCAPILIIETPLIIFAILV